MILSLQCSKAEGLWLSTAPGSLPFSFPTRQEWALPWQLQFKNIPRKQPYSDSISCANHSVQKDVTLTWFMWPEGRVCYQKKIQAVEANKTLITGEDGEGGNQGPHKNKQINKKQISVPWVLCELPKYPRNLCLLWTLFQGFLKKFLPLAISPFLWTYPIKS